MELIPFPATATRVHEGAALCTCELSLAGKVQNPECPEGEHTD